MKKLTTLRPDAKPDVLRYPHPVLRSDRLKRGQVQGITLLNRRYVLFRGPDGQVVAAPGACPHRGALLEKGTVNRAGQLVCAYHAWRVCADGRAHSASVPDKSCAVPLLRTWEQHGFIWVANADVPDSALPRFIEPGHQLITAFTREFAAPLPVVLDNFGEVEHAFQVHRFIGPSRDALHTAQFTSETVGDRSFGAFVCDYRTLPLGFSRFFGIAPGDRYHNDWTFHFRPLFGSYRNYWTAKQGDQRRPVSFIVTSFLVPTVEGRVNVHVFLQIAISGGLPRLLAPIIRRAAAAIVKFEIWADARIARFAPAAADQDGDSGGRPWQLTSWDKQIFKNRQLMESVYYGGGTAAEERVSPPAPEIAAP
jgi:phenylpropionate dioxygenase-like ring-hydroxylating dioxygenase large terminal subunit